MLGKNYANILPFSFFFRRLPWSWAQGSFTHGLHNGLLFFRGKIWLDPDSSFHTTLMEEYHATPLGGHMGFAKMLHHIQQNFYWSTMQNDVKQFVH